MIEQESLFRLGVKLYFKNTPELELASAVKVFHGWIQDGRLPGLLIDVADYRHVEGGPGVLLIAHEGNYGLSLRGRRPAFEYYQKRPGGTDIAERWRLACRRALEAALCLCGEKELGAALELDSSEICFFAHDRLLAPNSRATDDALRPVIEALVSRLYAGRPCAVDPSPDAAGLFALHVRHAPDVEAAVLLAAIAD